MSFFVWEFIVRVHLYRWARLLPDRTIFTRRRRWGAYILSSEPRRSFSNEFKLQMVKLASQPGASVARIAREHDIND
ncbi:transposase, partial [Escherichia coli]